MDEPIEREPSDEQLRRLLRIVETELDEERRGQDVDPTAQEAMDIRLRGLDSATRSLADPPPRDDP